MSRKGTAPFRACVSLGNVRLAEKRFGKAGEAYLADLELRLAQKNYFLKLEKQGDEIVRAIGGASVDPHSLIFLALLSAIDNAEQQVHLANEYFAADPQLLKALVGAALGILVVVWLASGKTSRMMPWSRFRPARRSRDHGIVWRVPLTGGPNKRRSS
jgi:hypothetical protein